MQPASPIRTLAAILLAGCPAGEAVAQASASPGWGRFEAAEAGAADANPLAVESRQPGVNLRLGGNFESLLKLDTADGSDVFARQDGAITAVFPRSVYLDPARGLGAQIPPGTVFVIGEPPAWLAESLRLSSLESARQEVRRPATLLDRSLGPIRVGPRRTAGAGAVRLDITPIDRRLDRTAHRGDAGAGIADGRTEPTDLGRPAAAEAKSGIETLLQRALRAESSGGR